MPTQPSRRHRIDRSRPALLQDVWFLEKLARFDEDTARAMGDAPEEIKARHIGNCVKADLAYGEGVANALGIPMGEVARIR